MYWIPKLHKNSVGFRFIKASKTCSTKPFSKVNSNKFKLIYCQIENFHCISKFLSNYNTFWVLQNVDPAIENINIISRKLNLLQPITLVLCTPHVLMINCLRGCAMLLILFLRMEIDHTFVFPNIMCHTEEKCQQHSKSIK